MGQMFWGLQMSYFINVLYNEQFDFFLNPTKKISIDSVKLFFVNCVTIYLVKEIRVSNIFNLGLANCYLHLFRWRKLSRKTNSYMDTRKAV